MFNFLPAFCISSLASLIAFLLAISIFLGSIAERPSICFSLTSSWLPSSYFFVIAGTGTASSTSSSANQPLPVGVLPNAPVIAGTGIGSSTSSSANQPLPVGVLPNAPVIADTRTGSSSMSAHHDPNSTPGCGGGAIGQASYSTVSSSSNSAK
jgi:hypothetical protein